MLFDTDPTTDIPYKLNKIINSYVNNGVSIGRG